MDKHESPTLDCPASRRVCGDLPYLLSLSVASGRCNSQHHWRLVLAGEGLPHTSSIQRSEMKRAERTDAVADELQPRPHTRNQPRRFVFSQHVPFSVHAPSAACSMERDQGAKEEGLGVRVRDIHDGARVGNPFADSCEAGGEAARVDWNQLA